MRLWLGYSLLAMFAWGSYVIAAKVTTSPKFFGLSPKISSMLMFAGIGLTFIFYWLMSGKQGKGLTAGGTVAGIITGVLWSLGMLFSFLSIETGADVSRLVPIYNCNTLVAVLLGIFVLREVVEAPQMFRILLGSVLIVAGGILVSR
ncbi:MAG: EamA family transporter [Phycisphaerae bacterium]|jgi:uncharacterized membrane protein